MKAWQKYPEPLLIVAENWRKLRDAALEFSKACRDAEMDGPTAMAELRTSIGARRLIAAGLLIDCDDVLNADDQARAEL